MTTTLIIPDHTEHLLNNRAKSVGLTTSEYVEFCIGLGIRLTVDDLNEQVQQFKKRIKK